MPGPLVAGIAGSVGSALMQTSAANKASKAQSAAADAQIAETRRQFDLVQGLLKPYVDSGSTALQGLLNLAGIGGTAASTPKIETIAGTVGAAGVPFGRYGLTGQGAAGTPETYRVNGQTFATMAEAQAYANANGTPGISANDAQQAAINGISNGAQFGELVKQGEYGLLANASATGGLRGGDTQAALAQFRPQMLQALIDKQLATLGGIASNGQNAASNTGTAAQNAGLQVNQALGEKGQAQAGAALATGQAWSNAGSGILNTLGQMAQPLTPGGGAWQKWVF